MINMAVTAVLVDIIKVENTLGEGVIWDAHDHAVWWTDIDCRMLYKYSPSDGSLEKWVTPERLGSFARVAGSDHLICAFDRGFAYFDPLTADLQWLHHIDSHSGSIRLNDGRADRQGRFWAGSMVEEPHKLGVKGEGAGNLYCLDRDLTCSSKITGITISNGLCWSPDSTVLYHTDTPSQRIDRYDFDSCSGAISNRTILLHTELGCFPDGCTVDSEGFLWSAQWAGSQVVRYSPEGEVDFVLRVPFSQPTCVAFGGPDLNMLFITSARQGLDITALESEPDAGNVCVFRTNVRGIQDSVFQPR